jgi:hypothetical protein
VQKRGSGQTYEAYASLDGIHLQKGLTKSLGKIKITIRNSQLEEF